MRAKPLFLPPPHLFPLLSPSRCLGFQGTSAISVRFGQKQAALSQPGMSEPPLFPLFFFSPVLGARLSHRLADDMPGWAEALGPTLPQGAAPDGVCSRSFSRIQITLSPSFLSAIRREEDEENGTWIK